MNKDGCRWSGHFNRVRSSGGRAAEGPLTPGGVPRREALQGRMRLSYSLYLTYCVVIEHISGI